MNVRFFYLSGSKDHTVIAIEGEVVPKQAPIVTGVVRPMVQPPEPPGSLRYTPQPFTAPCMLPL